MSNSWDCSITHFLPVYIGDYVKINYPISNITVANVEAALTNEERNGLHYAAGYVPRSLKKKLYQSSQCHKKILISLLKVLLDERYDDNDSTDWINLIDRKDQRESTLIHTSYFWLCKCACIKQRDNITPHPFSMQMRNASKLCCTMTMFSSSGVSYAQNQKRKLVVFYSE